VPDSTQEVREHARKHIGHSSRHLNSPMARTTGSIAGDSDAGSQAGVEPMKSPRPLLPTWTTKAAEAAAPLPPPPVLAIDAEQRMSVSIPGQRLNQASICTGAALSETSATAARAAGVNTASAAKDCDAGTSAIANGWRETLGVGDAV
jgi:hypothetical protein